jgi:hypothetical protein
MTSEFAQGHYIHQKFNDRVIDKYKTKRTIKNSKIIEYYLESEIILLAACR